MEELSLSGSQICLATRDKPTTPTIKYPLINQHRPSSAILLLQSSSCSPALNTTTNDIQKRLDYQKSLIGKQPQTFNKRPQSADTRIYSNNKHLNCINNNQFTKFSHPSNNTATAAAAAAAAAVDAARCEYIKQNNSTIQLPLSSSSSSPTSSISDTTATNLSTNIFNLLVKEQIKRTGSSLFDDSIIFQKSIVDHHQSKNSSNQNKTMTETDDYQLINSNNDKESNNNCNDDDDDEGNFINEPTTIGTKNSINNKISDIPLNNNEIPKKKNVSFNNNSEIIQLTSISPSYSSGSSSSSSSSSSLRSSSLTTSNFNQKQSKNWQLANDIRINDDDDDDDNKQIDLPGRVSFNNNNNNTNIYDDYCYDMENEQNDDEDYNINETKIDNNPNDNNSNAVHEHLSQQPITTTTESYIEQTNTINTISNNIINYCCSLKCNSTKLYTDVDDDDHNSYRDFTIKNSIYPSNHNTNTRTINVNDNESKESNNKIINQYNGVHSTTTTIDDKSNGYLKNTNTNKKTVNQSSNDENTNSDDDVIKNYLKVTNQKEPPNHINKMMKTSSISNNNFINKNPASCTTQTQSTQSSRSQSHTNKIKHNLCDEKKSRLLLTGIQIDNVESWMTSYDRNNNNTNTNFKSNHSLINNNNNNNNVQNDEELIDELQNNISKTIDKQNNYNNSYENQKQLLHLQLNDHDHDDDDEVDADETNESKTYNEIVAVIKEIDENNIKYNDKENEMIMKTNPTALMVKSSSSSSSLAIRDRSNNYSNYLLSSHHHHHDDADDVVDNEKNPNTDKMKEILLYLDEVDSKCEQTIQDVYSLKPTDSSRSEIEFTIEPPDIIGDLPKMNDLILLPNHQLARRIIAITLRANELTNAIQLTKEHMGCVRNERAKSIRLEKQNTQTQLKQQKLHYENIIQRHQSFIEQLLKDKSMLCEKVTGQQRRFDSQNQAWEHKLETELNQMKNMQMAGEKIRREKWIRENTKKIKELTVKGVENEINKMTFDHHQELLTLKKQHQQEILDAIEQTRNKHEQIELGIRNSYSEDRELAIETERNAIRLRFERQLTNEQQSFEEEKSRLLAEMNAERLKHNDELKVKERENERDRIEMQRRTQQNCDETINEYKNKLKIQLEKHQNELKSMEKQFEMDFQIWKKDYENQLKLAASERENSLREQYRLERDRQIDAIIAKIDMENLKTQQDFDGKLNRLQDKYEKELMDLETIEQKTKEMYLEIRSKLAGADVNCENLQTINKQLQIQLQHSQKLCDEYAQEKENFKEAARNEIQLEIGAMKREQACEIERVYKRVQQAIEKKDGSVELLQKENLELKERCIKLEAIIRQQRKDYCTK